MRWKRPPKTQKWLRYNAANKVGVQSFPLTFLRMRVIIDEEFCGNWFLINYVRWGRDSNKSSGCSCIHLFFIEFGNVMVAGNLEPSRREYTLNRSPVNRRAHGNKPPFTARFSQTVAHALCVKNGLDGNQVGRVHSHRSANAHAHSESPLCHQLMQGTKIRPSDLIYPRGLFRVFNEA